MLTFFIGPAFANESNKPFCHLHPPGAETTEDAAQLIKFKSSSDCFKANRLRYSGKGRCHCSFRFFSNSKRLPFNRGNREQDERGNSPVQ